MLTWNGFRPMAHAISIDPVTPDNMPAKMLGVGMPREARVPATMLKIASPMAPPEDTAWSVKSSTGRKPAQVAKATTDRIQQIVRDGSFRPTLPSTSHTPQSKGGTMARTLATPND